MTSPSAPRPGTDPPDPSRAAEEIRAGDAPPAEAVTLADLIADSGPLPADAALECVQRLAERLTLTPRFSCAALGPADVLIDDDGGVWLRPGMASAMESPSEMPKGMDRLGHLLAFLATGNGVHLSDCSTVNAAELPGPLSAVAGRLFSRNGAGYRSYAELASEAADLRGVVLSAAAPAIEPRHDANEPHNESAAPQDRAPVTESSEERARSPFGVALILAAGGGAVVAYLLWQIL